MFFITGLPRSRTKWFSEYFTGLKNVYCYHEALNGCESKDHFDIRMRAPFAKHVGNSDSGLMITDFQQRFMAPTVIIERDLDEVAESLSKQFGALLFEEGEGRKHLEKNKAQLDRLTGLRIPFDEIDERLQEIHEYLVPVPFDEEHAQTLINRRIQVDNLSVNLRSYRIWGN
jgi:hypothetical protein